MGRRAGKSAQQLLGTYSTYLGTYPCLPKVGRYLVLYHSTRCTRYATITTYLGT